MITTILAYVIAVLGFVMICGGIYSFFDLWNARAPLRHCAITIGTSPISPQLGRGFLRS